MDKYVDDRFEIHYMCEVGIGGGYLSAKSYTLKQLKDIGVIIKECTSISKIEYMSPKRTIKKYGHILTDLQIERIWEIAKK